MSDQQFVGDEAETEELDLNGEEESLEDVMKDALEAIEKPPADDGPFATVGAVDPDNLEGLRLELAEQRDRAMRTLADFDNFRKRVERERREQKRYAGSEILRELLSVVDNLERASSAEGSAEELREGVALILRQLADLLRRHGVERVTAQGERFDPAAHEAVVRHASDEFSEPTIVKELQAGYWLRDRLLRPALVEVAVPDSAATPKSGEDD